MIHKFKVFTSFSVMSIAGFLTFNLHAESCTKIDHLRRLIENSSITNKQEILANADTMEPSEQQHYLQRKVDSLRGLSDSAISYEERNPNALKGLRDDLDENIFSNSTPVSDEEKEDLSPQAHSSALTNPSSDMDASVAVSNSAVPAAPREQIVRIETQTLMPSNSNNARNSVSGRNLTDLKTAYAKKYPDRADSFRDEFEGVPESQQVAILSHQLGFDRNQDG